MHVRLMLLVGLSTVLAVIAVSALVAPVPPGGEEPGSEPRPARASPPPSVEKDLTPAAGRPFVLSAAETGQVVSLAPDTAARIEVHATEPVSVQLGDDGPVALAEPGTPAEFPVFGEEGAEGPIRLLEPTREIGRVEVE